MTYDEFKKKVFEALREDFHMDLTEEQLKEELPDYEDIIKEGQRSIYGEQSGIDYAANNIALIL